MITRSPRFGACPRRIESEKETPRRRLGPDTPAKKRCHSASTLWYGDSNVLHAPLEITASQIRPLLASANEPTKVAPQTDAPRKRTNTVGSLAASPART